MYARPQYAVAMPHNMMPPPGYPIMYHPAPGSPGAPSQPLAFPAPPSASHVVRPVVSVQKSSCQSSARDSLGQACSLDGCWDRARMTAGLSEAG